MILDSGCVKLIDCVLYFDFLQNFSIKLRSIFIVSSKYLQYVYVLVFAILAEFFVC
jgi:hypothetical protein